MISLNSLIKKAINDLPVPDLSEPNLKLTFQVGTGVFITDSVGNEPEQKKPLIILAHVREEDTREKAIESSGTGLYQVYLQGRLANPKVYPANVNMEEIAEAEYIYAPDPAKPRNKITQKGEFRFMANLNDRYPELTQKLGCKISGMFTVRASV